MLVFLNASACVTLQKVVSTTSPTMNPYDNLSGHAFKAFERGASVLFTRPSFSESKEQAGILICGDPQSSAARRLISALADAHLAPSPDSVRCSIHCRYYCITTLTSTHVGVEDEYDRATSRYCRHALCREHLHVPGASPTVDISAGVNKTSALPQKRRDRQRRAATPLDPAARPQAKLAVCTHYGYQARSYHKPASESTSTTNTWKQPV